MLCGEGRDRRRQPRNAEGERHREAQGAGHVPFAAGDGLARRLELVQNRRAARLEFEPGLGRRNAARRAVQEPHAEIGFEPRDPAADDRFR